MWTQVNTGQVHTSEASNPFGPDKMTQVLNIIATEFWFWSILQSEMGGEPTGKEAEQNGPLPSFAKYDKY